MMHFGKKQTSKRITMLGPDDPALFDPSTVDAWPGDLVVVLSPLRSRERYTKEYIVCRDGSMREVS
jgi:hypothetical protein